MTAAPLLVGCALHDGADIDACGCPALDSPGAIAYRGLLVKARAEIARLTAELAAAHRIIAEQRTWLGSGEAAKSQPRTDTGAIVADVLACAEAWAPEARVIGNVRADEIAAMCHELAAARAVPADVEAAIAATNYAMDRDEAADKLRAAFARAISDATAARGTVGGLLATAPVGSIVEWMAGEFRGQSWRRVVVGSDPVNVSCWLAVAERWSDYAVPIASSSFGMPARLAPAHLADLDPATRGPLPKGG